MKLKILIDADRYCWNWNENQNHIWNAKDFTYFFSFIFRYAILLLLSTEREIHFCRFVIIIFELLYLHPFKEKLLITAATTMIIQCKISLNRYLFG